MCSRSGLESVLNGIKYGLPVFCFQTVFFVEDWRFRLVKEVSFLLSNLRLCMHVQILKYDDKDDIIIGITSMKTRSSLILYWFQNLNHPVIVLFTQCSAFRKGL